jgi:hypothetical protein
VKQLSKWRRPRQSYLLSFKTAGLHPCVEMHCQKGDKNPLSRTKTYAATSSSNIFASCRSRVSSSSVNQPVNGAEQFAGLLRLARPETRMLAVSHLGAVNGSTQWLQLFLSSLAIAYTTLEIRFAFGPSCSGESNVISPAIRLMSPAASEVLARG